MLTLTPEARSALLAAIKKSGVENPAISLVKMGPFVRRDAPGPVPRVDKDAILVADVRPRTRFSRWSLVNVDGITICMPFYIRFTSLILTHKDGALQLVNKRGKRVL
ncbi:MAG: hypothetical protein ACXV3D_07490 [Halobacteriota archaeon]